MQKNLSETYDNYSHIITQSTYPLLQIIKTPRSPPAHVAYDKGRTIDHDQTSDSHIA